MHKKKGRKYGVPKQLSVLPSNFYENDISYSYLVEEEKIKSIENKSQNFEMVGYDLLNFYVSLKGREPKMQKGPKFRHINAGHGRLRHIRRFKLDTVYLKKQIYGSFPDCDQGVNDSKNWHIKNYKYVGKYQRGIINELCTGVLSPANYYNVVHLVYSTIKKDTTISKEVIEGFERFAVKIKKLGTIKVKMKKGLKSLVLDAPGKWRNEPDQIADGKQLNQFLRTFELKETGQFLKTQFGRLFVSEQKVVRLNLMLTEEHKNRYAHDLNYYNNLEKAYSLSLSYKKLLNASNFGNIYDMLTRNEQVYVAPEYNGTEPHKAFVAGYFEHKKSVGQSVAKYKRYVYEGSLQYANKDFIKAKLRQKYRPYNRLKHPKFYKTNRLFYRYSSLLRPGKHNKLLKSDQHRRMRQLISKVIFPFYGSGRLKQFKKFFKRIQVLKSIQESKEERLLSKLEYRIDVLAYRLNLAPTLAGARHFVRNGGIYLYEKNTRGDLLYGNVLNIAYPLMLRDPKGLYDYNQKKYAFIDVFKKPNGLGLYQSKYSTLKYFTTPITNPDYVANVGDVVQASPRFMQEKGKLKKQLLEKPIPSHLYTVLDGKGHWVFYRNIYQGITTAPGQKETLSYITAVILTKPKGKNYKYEERIKAKNFKFLCLS